MHDVKRQSREDVLHVLSFQQATAVVKILRVSCVKAV